MNKKLLVKDLPLAAARTIIGIQQDKVKQASTTERVLAELIRFSTGGFVEQHPQVAAAISHKLVITPEQYRQATSKLRKLQIIKSFGSTIELMPIATTPFDQLTIAQK